MKTNLCRMLRSCLALLLICSMIVVQIPATALATKSQDVNDDGVINYVALGASNTNGYGLNGYMPSGVHEDPLAAPKGALNVYGYKQAPESAYPAQVKNMIDLFNDGLLDGDVTLNQLAISSMRVEEALYLLGDEYDYVNDDYMQWRFTGGQNWFAIAEPGGVSALRTAYQNALSTADVISIDLGWNNFGVYAFNNIKTILAGYDPDEDGELDFWKEPDFDAVLTDEEKVKYDEIKAKVMEMLSENIEGDKLKNKLDLMADALAYATLGAIVHFDSLVEWIYENNADAKIVVVNIQNLADDLVVEFEGETLELGDMYGELIDMVNLYRADKSPYADKYSFANAGDVETFLDELVAWDGDPAKLTNDMKDCFDFYQDNPGFFVRSIVEYMMVGQAMSGLFKGLRDTGASYGISVFKDSAPNVADSEGYVYEFELTRTVEQLLALNLGALDLSNPAGSDKDVELYGKALSQHLKNLRGDGKLDAYNYVFENVCADLEAKKMNVAGGLGQVFAGINAVAAAQGIPTNFNVDGYYQVLTGRTDATVNGETVADFTAMFYADYTANGENKLVKFSEYLDVFAAVAMQVPDVITGLKKAADGYAEIMQGINVIIPEAKAAFTEKLQGIYDSYHNTLDYTYDILATIVQYLAKINTITMGEEMNLSNTNALATFITNSFMNGAQSKFYYELEKNGVQATGAPEVPEFVITDDMIAQAGLNDPATIAIGVFAVRYDIGNSFFAHPNEKGHAQITEAIFKALTEGSDAEDFSNTKILLYTQILKNRYPNLYAIVTGANQVGELDDLAIIFAMLKLVNNPAINMMDLDELQAQIRDANRDYAASKTPEEQAKAQAIVSELLKRLYQMVTYVTGTVYKPTADSYYVSLGDSTITGYGFDGYEDNQKNGWGQNVEGSAHLLLAQKYFGDNWENQFANYCQGALRADDLLYFLGGDVAIDDYYKHEIEESLPFGTIEETQKQFVATVKKADLISVAIGGGNVLTFVGKQMNRVMNGQEALKLDWSKIGINEDEASMKELNEALDLLVPIVDELGLLDQYVPAEMKPLKNPAKLTRALAESLLYGYASYNYYYPLVLERIKEINPDAQLMIIGMFNPVDDWSMTTEINGEATVINIGGATGNLIATANLQSLAFALQHEKTTFVDISDAETHLEADNPGKKLEFSDYFGGALRLNGKGVHASEEGHEYIVKQMSDALNGGIEGALLDTYNYVMNLVNKVDAILNNNLSGVITDLQGDLTVLCGELNTKFNVLNAQLQKLTDAERAILNEMLAERDVLVEQLEDQKAQLEMLFSGQQARTYSLNRTSNSAEALIAETQSKIAETEAAIAALDSSIAALNAKIAADLENVDVIRSSISAIQAKINALLAVLADAIPAVKKLNTDLKKLYDASMVLAAAIDNVNDLTFDKIDVQAVVNAINTIYSLMPTIIEQTEDVYNKTQTAYENAKLAATSLKVTIDTIETAMNDIVDGMEVVAGIEATKLAAIQVAVAQCQEAVKSFVNDNYGAVETALLNSHNQLKDLAYGEIAKAQNVLVENKTLILAVVSGAVLALQKAGFIEVENGQVALTPDYQKLVVDYIQSLNDKLAELRERVETSKQWLNNNYPTARTELNNKLKALCEKLSKLETQMREELDIQKQEVLKIECEQLKKLIAEVTAKQTKLEVYAQEVLDYIATVEAAIADVQTALNDVIAAGAVVGSDIEALWNKLMALTPVLDELAKTVNGLSYKILNELYEIFEYCGIIADNFVAVLKTLPAYVDILRNAVNLTIDTWNVLVKTTCQTINNILNAATEIQKNIVNKHNNLILEMHNTLNALIEIIENELKTATGEAKTTLQNMLKAAIALKVGLVELVQGNIYSAIAKIQSAYNSLVAALNSGAQHLNATIRNQLMILVNYLRQSVIELVKDFGEAVKNIVGDYYNALIQEVADVLTNVDAWFVDWMHNHPAYVLAWLNAQGENFLNFLEENIDEIIYNACHGEYTVTDNSYYAAITGNGNGYVGLLANALWLNSAQYGSMTWDNLDYLSLMKADLITLGYDESTLNAFAVEQLLGYVNAYVDVELRGSAKAYANGIANSLLTEIPFLKPEAFAGVAGGVDTAIDGLLAHELLENRQMKELDWAALVGEENLGYVDQVMDELEAQMIKNGIPEYYEIEIDVVDFLFENAAAMGIEYVLNMLEPEALKVTLGEYAIYTIQIPVREALLFAAESYLYGNLEFQKKYDEIMLLLYAFNPNATVILLGNYNAFRQVDLTIGDVSVELSEAYKSIVKISSVHSFAYAVAMPNVIYVDIPDVQTNYEYYVAAGYIENSVENFLGAYISDITTTQASPIGNEYIKNQILAALTVTCEHKYTDVCVDSVCTRCGVIREDVAHSFTNYISDNNATCTEDGTKTAKCDRCDATNTIVDIGSALQHDWSDWYTVKEPTNDEVGEERRDCLNDGCEHYETREIPKIVKVDPEYTVPSDLTAKYGDTLADIALPEGFTWKDATASVGNAGVNTFIAIYTPEDTIHYNVVEIEVTIMVEKSNASVTNAPSAMGTLIANGTAQTLVQAGTATGGTMVYSLSENGPFTETLPTATNAGVYTVYYKVKGDTNHNDTQVQSLTITVYPDKITSDEHLVDEGTYIRKVKAGLTVEQFWNNINENAYVTIFDKDGNVVDSNALVATGMVAKLIVNGEVVDSVTVIVTGDVNGDGKITITDMCAVQHHVLETNLITGVYLLAADTQNDGKVTMTDFVQIQHHVLEISQIVEN